MNYKFRSAMLVLLGLSGCASVEQPTESGVHVRVAYMSQVDACKDLGKVSVKVADHLLFVERTPEAMAIDLEILGQNTAADMGGDTIVTMSRVVNGEQLFRVYRCRDRDKK
ncbi:MAG: DUF4156 domain-containing protein [Mariprofundus sp.]|nr:DUF4156 domain-containing protein [Mariprofundus sp.]